MILQSLIEERVSTTIDSILFILWKMGGSADFHKIFKILYFAERDHLVRYGKPITGDKYVAMENGPVPSIAYDILKSLKSEGLMFAYKDQFASYFKLESPYIVSALKEFDPDNLSSSAIESLDFSVKQYGAKSFSTLTRLSHDEAWKKAILNNEMSFIEMAKSGGANEDMLEYIMESLENSESSFY